jgi:N6-L-threonylcarbamoyladenine synthase
MYILGIETSCDETALALIETRGSGDTFECRVLSSLIHSQAELHSPYGGVFPTLAKREHEKNLPILLKELMATTSSVKIDAIAVTEGPGLEPALWTGIVFAEQLAKEWNVPIIPVNHMEGHVIGSLLKSDAPQGEWQSLLPLNMPALALLISGGHTELVTIERGEERMEHTSSPSLRALRWSHSSALRGRVLHPFRYTIIGQTKDDAVGEAFDKTARLLGIPYPGGPRLSALAQEARSEKIESPVKLPRPMISSKDLDFSFSGLKTAVLYAVRDAESTGTFTDTFKKGLAREFEDAVVETLSVKLRKAIDQVGAQTVIIGGGVSANMALRTQFEAIAAEYGIPLYQPSRHISGDNALMIALAGAFNIPTDRALKAHGTKRLGN